MTILTTKDLQSTYPDLVEQIIKEAQGEYPEPVIKIEKDKAGNITRWVEEIRDEKGELISKRTDTYTYHKSGEVKDIVQVKI